MPNNVSPYIYVGYECNNNCIFCSEADEYVKQLKKKSLQEIKKEIVQARKYYDFISFMGREPTLRKDIFDILEFAVKLDFKQVGVTTNGRMLSYPDFTQNILRTGIKQIGISLSGATAKIHDRQTQVQGSFQQTIQGIKNVIKFKDPEISLLINFPLNRLNYFELNKMIKLVMNLGVKEINILFISPLSKRSRTKKIVMKMSELGKYIFKTIKPYLNKSDVKFLMIEFLPCSLSKEARNYFFPCLEKNSNKVRIPLCKNCPYKNKCDGVLQGYIDLYGINEFKL